MPCRPYGCSIWARGCCDHRKLTQIYSINYTIYETRPSTSSRMPWRSRSLKDRLKPSFVGCQVWTLLLPMFGGLLAFSPPWCAYVINLKRRGDRLKKLDSLLAATNGRLREKLERAQACQARLVRCMRHDSCCFERKRACKGPKSADLKTFRSRNRSCGWPKHLLRVARSAASGGTCSAGACVEGSTPRSL